MKTILYNARIITMSNNDEKSINPNSGKIEETEYKQALCYENGIIQKVGNNEEILELKDKNTKVIDMEGKTILPSFVDAHSHFSAVANSYLQVDLNECNSFEEIKSKILEYKAKNNITDDEWIIANGYDNNTLKEQRHPDIEFLNTLDIKNPVVLKHKSEHMGVFNEKALKELNVNEQTKSPEGGKIEIKEHKLTGYMEENAFVQYLKKVPMPSIDKLLKAYEKAQDKYLSYGITTVQEGYMSKELLNIYKELIRQNKLKIDVVGYPDYDSIEEYKKIFPNSYKKYNQHFKIQGLKMILDGSPQGRTAWMKEPYEIEKQDIAENKTEKQENIKTKETYEEEEYKGYLAMKYADIVRNIKYAKENNLQILAHCNGDAAAEEYIKACEEVGNVEKLRPVIIHAQLITKEELIEAKKLGLIPSFFVAHVYYWGDTHIKNFGEKRASKISPVKEAVDNNMIYTLHQDSPIIEPNMLETIWCVVKRQTKSGRILGTEEKITVYEALKGITINAAYSYFEENEKGSIEEGKKAEFVILDKNPLEVPVDEIPKIKILETIY